MRLGEALAHGRSDAASRAVLTAWLGADLAAPLDVLAGALEAARARPEDPLSADLALDVAERAQVVWLAASYDESHAHAAARDLRLRAQAMRARSASGMSGGLDEVLEARSLEEQAETLEASSAALRLLAQRAAETQRASLALVGESP